MLLVSGRRPPHLFYMSKNVKEPELEVPATTGAAHKTTSASATSFDLMPWIVPPIVIPLVITAALAVQIIINMGASQ